MAKVVWRKAPHEKKWVGKVDKITRVLLIEAGFRWLCWVNPSGYWVDISAHFTPKGLKCAKGEATRALEILSEVLDGA